MNSLIVFPEELTESNKAILRGARAQYIREWHDIHEGLTLRGGIWSGKKGEVTVESISDDEIALSVRCEDEPLKRSDSHVIVAVPRPQTVKKVIQAVTAFGAGTLHFVRTEGVVPSYLSSKVLTQEAIQIEILKALEQCCDSIPPIVRIHAKWWVFSKEVLSELSVRYEEKFVAHTKAPEQIGTMTHPSVVAIGPESGWVDAEIEIFLNNGFKLCSLGSRMLRVEHAVIKLISAVKG